MRRLVLPLIAGALFAVGLVVGGMTQPSKVIGFLDFAGTWDPSLAFVMLGAIGLYLPVHRWVLQRGAPLFAKEHSLPTRAIIDRRLVVGAALFGVGWGLAGFCPGPAIVSLAGAAPQALVFVVAMLIGMRGHERYAQASTPSAAVNADARDDASNATRAELVARGNRNSRTSVSP